MNFALSYFPATRLVCAPTQWDLPKAALLSQRPAASTHPGKRGNTEEWTGLGWNWDRVREDLISDTIMLGGGGGGCKMFMFMHANLDKVQLGPSDDHRAFSSLFRCSWRKEMPPTVMAGLSTDAAMAGPPVVLTICECNAEVSVSKIGKECETPKGLSPQNKPTRSRGTKTGCTNSGASGFVIYGLSRA